MEAEVTEHLPAVDRAFSKLDSTLAANEARREVLLGKLMTAAGNIDLEKINEMRASDRESLMGVFSTVDSVMKSQEAGQVNNVRLILSKKTEETNANHADAVLELLKRIDPSAAIAGSLAGGAPPEEVDNEISDVYAESEDDISDEELEPVGSQ